MMANSQQKVCLCLFASFALLQLVHSQSEQNVMNNRPVLGVLLLENGDKSGQFIGASYVKYIESAGARVVPIFLKQNQEYYQSMVSSLNGILMPGGSNSLTHSDYAQAADFLIEAAIEANKNGTHFPMWGTCLSFQKLIAYFTGNNIAWMSYCDIENIALNLKSVEANSRIFGNWSSENTKIMNILKVSPVTANYHKWCLNVTEFNGIANITNNFKIVSTNDFGGHHFVSTIEHTKYPFYGSAWHPEKNQFEFVVNAHKGNISHSFEAVQVSQFLANFLVFEARKNTNHFKNKLEEGKHLIYNYNGQYRVYTGMDEKAVFEEEYRFPLHFSGFSGKSSATHLCEWTSMLLVFLCFRLSVSFI